MRKLSTGLVAKQAGFTLIELVIVIVIIGILAAVAIPKLSGVSDEAKKAKNTAILGALKSSWSTAYAMTKGAPNIAGASGVVQQMTDPICTNVGTTITCGDATTTFTAAADPVTSSAQLTCTTASLCN
jgi:prepilin-type N-terminal cleavage/methylation domain-containing protein